MSRNHNPHKTMENILSTSERLFLEKGYEKTTTQAIINATGIAKGTLFHHFKSKEDILVAVLARYNAQVAQQMEARLDQMGVLTAREKIVALFDWFYDNAQTSPLSKLASLSRSPQLLIEDVKGWVAHVSPIVSRLIEEGNGDGSLHTDYPQEVAELFNLLFCLWCDPAVLAATPESLRRRLQFIQHTMRCLGVDVASDTFIDKSLVFAQSLYT